MMRGVVILDLEWGVVVTVSGMGYAVAWPNGSARYVNFPTRRIGHA